MKKLTLTVGICLLAVTAFGQKKAVSSVKSEITATKPNIEEARALIKGALTDPETANNAETWFVAGRVENKAFELEQAKEYIGQKANDDVMYPALDAIYPYFSKAEELDQLPDAKGKVKPKFHKDIKAIMTANRPYYINAGSYFYEKENYQKAYDNFKFYGDIPGLALVDGNPAAVASTLASDTTAVKIRYYAALSASLIPNNDAAIALYEEIKNLGYNEDDVYKRLAASYIQTGDSTNFISVLQQGADKFPNESYYLLNLINININRGESDAAINDLKKAIAVTPNNAQLYDVLGLVYENTKNEDKAIEYVKKALEIDPDFVDALSHLGRLYYNAGVTARGEADDLKDPKAYDVAKVKINDLFKAAIPYFEKAYQLDSKQKDAVFALRNIYYSLGNNEAYEKWDKIYAGE